MSFLRKHPEAHIAISLVILQSSYSNTQVNHHCHFKYHQSLEIRRDSPGFQKVETASSVAHFQIENSWAE